MRGGNDVLKLLAGEDVGRGEVSLGVSVLARLGRRDVHHLNKRATSTGDVLNSSTTFVKKRRHQARETTQRGHI